MFDFVLVFGSIYLLFYLNNKKVTELKNRIADLENNDDNWDGYYED